MSHCDMHGEMMDELEAQDYDSSKIDSSLKTDRGRGRVDLGTTPRMARIAELEKFWKDNHCSEHTDTRLEPYDDGDGIVFECPTGRDSKDFDWTINGVFSKFGNKDGNFDTSYTHIVVELLEKHGYEVESDAWGCHNEDVIIRITKNGEKLYPPEEGFRAGYDDVFDVLPEELATLLKNAAESEEWKKLRCIGLGSGGCDF